MTVICKGVHLNPRTALQDLIAKVFSAPFAKTFSAPLGGAVAAKISWWLTGNIPAANCLGAWQAKGAASLAASYINLANPGTYDLTAGSAPTWNSTDGWISDGTKYLRPGFIPKLSVIVRYSGGTNLAANSYIYGSYDGSLYLCIAPNSSIAPYNTPPYAGLFRHNSADRFPPGPVAGVICYSNHVCYQDGTNVGTSGNGNYPTKNAWILAANNSDTGLFGTGWVGNVQAIAIYDIALATYVVALSAAIAAL